MLPAYDQCIKASHAFNLLDARGVISVTERQSYILRVRDLAKACGAAWLRTEAGGGRDPRRRYRHSCPISSSNFSVRRNPRAHADAGRARPEAAGDRGARRQGAPLRRGRELFHAAAACPACGGAAGRAARYARGEAKVPRVGAPDAAIAGFVKSAGLAFDRRGSDRERRQERRVLRCRDPGPQGPSDARRSSPRSCPAVIETFPWPKSMRWGAESVRPASLRWVRPLHSIVATFGPETEDPDDRPAFGPRHRRPAIDDPRPSFHGAGRRWSVRRFDDYAPALERAKVVLDAERRRDIILHDARTLAMAQGFDLVEDEGLLHEVAGLVEWPVVLMGEFEEAFLSIPPEVDPGDDPRQPEVFRAEAGSGTDRLANRFILVANIEASDGGAAIAAGNGKVVRARLSDARFFWESDLKIRLDDRLPKLDYDRLPCQARHARRPRRAPKAALAADLAPLVGRRSAARRRVPRTLAKADLVTEMVGEFPELQGLMGRYYAAAQGEDAGRGGRRRRPLPPAGPDRPRARRRRSRSPPPWPTSSTRSFASGPSMKSRPAARTRTRCGGRRSA